MEIGDATTADARAGAGLRIVLLGWPGIRLAGNCSLPALVSVRAGAATSFPSDSAKYSAIPPVTMASDSEYDPTLTRRAQADLEAMGVPSAEERSELSTLFRRLEGDLQRRLSDDTWRERTLGYLGGPQSGKADSRGEGASEGEPIRRTLKEVVGMSARLDALSDPSEGLAAAQTAAERAHTLAHTVEGLLSALDPADAITSAFRRLIAYLGQLLRNALARIKEYAKRLGVSSFSVALSSAPPGITVTFTFGSS